MVMTNHSRVKYIVLFLASLFILTACSKDRYEPLEVHYRYVNNTDYKVVINVYDQSSSTEAAIDMLSFIKGESKIFTGTPITSDFIPAFFGNDSIDAAQVIINDTLSFFFASDISDPNNIVSFCCYNEIDSLNGGLIYEYQISKLLD